MPNGDYQIPFDNRGNQQHYPQGWYVGEYPNHKPAGPEWRDNAPFEDALRFVGYRRGRSAAYFAFQRSDGTEVTMFLKDFEAAVPIMERGLVRGKFQFIKRGQNYGVRLLEDA
jgi:hypothetical protein